MKPQLKDYYEMNEQLEQVSDRLELTDETLRPLALKIRLLAKELRDTTYNKFDYEGSRSVNDYYPRSSDREKQ